MSQTSIPQIDPAAVDLVMKKEAEELTDSDIDLLIAFFRKEREGFVANEAAGKKANAKRSRDATNLDTSTFDDFLKGV